ncbi:MAG: glycine cleavage system aminomethyltransferase GcvT [Burkholderiales bacterium]|jgi:aminomethyltransferase|nr:glycine cleavage system aminomethyltransferase GcvT [Burkholderiales bacterium]
MIKQTHLNSSHRAASARMVDFGGWDMPVNYGSQVNEHHAVRKDAGMFDVSHMCVIDVQSKEAGAPRAFLRYLLANNVDKLETSGRALYSCLLKEDGGVLDDLIVYFIDETFFRIVVNAGTAEKDYAWFLLQRDRVAPNCTITPRRDLSMIAVQGKNARAKVWAVLPQTKAATEPLRPFSAAFVGDYFVARTGYTGEDGFEIAAPHDLIVALWANLIKAQVAPCGLGARDTLRLEAGMNLYGQDMDETVTPLEAGLSWTVDLKSERDFIGKNALIQQKPAFTLLGLVLTDTGGVLRSHQRVHTDHGEGEITSGTFSPTLNRSIALARLPIQTKEGDTVTVSVRDKKLSAKVVRVPFAKNGAPLIQL